MSIIKQDFGEIGGVDINTFFQNTTSEVKTSSEYWSPPTFNVPTGATYVIADVSFGGKGVGESHVTWANAEEISDMYNTYETTPAGSASTVISRYVGLAKLDGSSTVVVGANARDFTVLMIFVYE